MCVCVLNYFSLLCSSSWETIFSKSSEVVSPQELQCCRRLVQLCRDCLLVVYKFVSESRGSLTGLSPEWDDTRWDGHPSISAVFLKESSSFPLPQRANYPSSILYKIWGCSNVIGILVHNVEINSCKENWIELFKKMVMDWSRRHL